MKVKSLSCVRLYVTTWTAAFQAPPLMGFSRQEYWSGLPFPSPEDIPDPGIDPGLRHCRQMVYHLSHQRSPSFEFSSVQSLSCVQLFATPWTAAHQASLSINNSRSLPRLMSIESVMPSNHLILSSSSPTFNLSQHQGLFK